MCVSACAGANWRGIARRNRPHAIFISSIFRHLHTHTHTHRSGARSGEEEQGGRGRANWVGATRGFRASEKKRKIEMNFPMAFKEARALGLTRNRSHRCLFLFFWRKRKEKMLRLKKEKIEGAKGLMRNRSHMCLFFFFGTSFIFPRKRHL